MRRVFDRFPQVSRTVYLVDEEFIGRDIDAGSRALDIARVMDGAGFRWESSCRVDQVVRPDHGLGWHAGVNPQALSAPGRVVAPAEVGAHASIVPSAGVLAKVDSSR